MHRHGCSCGDFDAIDDPVHFFDACCGGLGHLLEEVGGARPLRTAVAPWISQDTPPRAE